MGNEGVNLTNIIVIAAGILSMLGMALFFLYKMNKARPDLVTYEKERDRLANELIDSMYKEITTNEEKFRGKVDDISYNAKLRIESHFASNYVCYSCKRTLEFSLSDPLFKAGRKNNFAKMLDKRMYAEYQKELLAQIQAIHVKQQSPIINTRCTITEYFPKAEEIHDFLESVVAYWTSSVLIEFTNLTKIDLEACYRYKHRFMDDKYQAGRIDINIQKYQDQLNNLEKRTTTKKVYEDRRAG